LTQEQVAQGVTLRKACEILQSRYDVRNRTWASYGDYDREQFERECASFKVPYPFGPTHLNVKALFSLIYGMSYEVGMSKALQILNIPLEGTHHRGHDDAWNIAAILAELLIARRAVKQC
jgi:inhibitor of KinA sporulation pathway (predicted exonuclease)